MAVCEGYALAFEHLMHQAGRPCSYVSGDARHEWLNETDDRGHAWNVVKIDNRWYEVDTTWNDHDISDFQDKPEAIKKALEANESIRYNYCHYFFILLEHLQYGRTFKNIAEDRGYSYRKASAVLKKDLERLVNSYYIGLVFG